MSEDVRRVVIALGVAFVAVGGYYRIQSQRGGEPLNRRLEGVPLLIGIRLAGLLTFVSLLALLYNPARFAAFALPIPESLQWVGVVAFALSVGWLVWMFRSLGRNLTDTVVTRSNATFVNYGPYRIVRNPMYTGVLMVGFSLAVALATWLVPLGALLIFTLLAIRTKTEERFLLERFGDQYRDYMSRVGRFFPKLSARGSR